jgi:hypothetical protein
MYGTARMHATYSLVPAGVIGGLPRVAVIVGWSINSGRWRSSMAIDCRGIVRLGNRRRSLIRRASIPSVQSGCSILSCRCSGRSRVTILSCRRCHSRSLNRLGRTRDPAISSRRYSLSRGRRSKSRCICIPTACRTSLEGVRWTSTRLSGCSVESRRWRTVEGRSWWRSSGDC